MRARASGYEISSPIAQEITTSSAVIPIPHTRRMP